MRALEEEAVVSVRGAVQRNRTASEYQLSVGLLGQVPRNSGNELLNALPGISLSQDGNEGHATTVFLRGFFGEDGRDIAFSLEGVPLNDESNPEAQGYCDNWAVIPEVVSRVDLTAGTADPRQGNFAIAGSVDFRLGVRDRGYQARALVGLYGQRRLTLIAAPRGEQESTFLAVDLAHGDGFGPSRSYDRFSGIGQYGFNLPGGFSGRLLALFYTGRFEAPGVIRQDDVDGGRDFFATYAGTGPLGGRSLRALFSSVLEYSRGDDKVELRFWAQGRDYALNENFTGVLERPTGDLAAFDYRSTSLGTNGYYRRYATLFQRRHELELGWSLRHDRFSSSETGLDASTNQPLAPLTEDSIAVNASVTTLGVYADLTARVLPWLTLRGGPRFDGIFYNITGVAWDEDERDHRPMSRATAAFSISPKFSAEFALGQGFSLLASYGQGFRTRHAFELLTAHDGNVNPSRVGGEELGLRYTMLRPVRGMHRLSASLTAYHSFVDRDLLFDPTTGETEEVGATHRVGGTLWARVQPLPSIDLNASFTYTHGLAVETRNNSLGGPWITAGAQLPGVPSLVARFDGALDHQVASFRNQPVRVRAGVGVGVRGPLELAQASPSPTVALVDAMVGVRFGPVTLDVSARNLLDTRWRDAVFQYSSDFQTMSTQSPVTHFTAGAPRTGWLTLSLAL